MVWRQYYRAKMISAIFAIIVIAILMAIILVPILEIASSGPSYRFPTSSEISNAAGLSVNFTEQGTPKSINGSVPYYNSCLVSGQYVYYNSTSDGSFKLIEFKTSSTNNSIGLYSSIYDRFKADYRNDTSASSISPNLSAFKFTYFYFSSSGFLNFKASIGYSGVYMFYLLYAGSAAVDINNTAEAVILQM